MVVAMAAHQAFLIELRLSSAPVDWAVGCGSASHSSGRAKRFRRGLLRQMAASPGGRQAAMQREPPVAAPGRTTAVAALLSVAIRPEDAIRTVPLDAAQLGVRSVARRVRAVRY
jgi:hypothetical protein